MKKKFAIEALKKIKEISEKTHTLYKLGVDLIEFENGTELLTKSLALLLVGEKDYKEAIDDIDWWLYEDVEKKIYLNGKKTIDVETAEQFVDWLVDWYKKKTPTHIIFACDDCCFYPCEYTKQYDIKLGIGICGDYTK